MVQVDWKDIDFYFENSEAVFKAYIDTQTGQVFTSDEFDLDEDLDDPEHFVEIPKSSSRTDYNVLVGFIDTVNEPVLRQKLEMAIQGAGAFSRFNSALTQFPYERKRWVQYKVKQKIERARVWASQYDIELYNTPAFIDEQIFAPEPELPRSRLSFSDYQTRARETLLTHNQNLMAYLALGLGGESGEIQNKLKKVLRGDYDVKAVRDDIADELGDVLWYLAMLADEMGFDLGTIAEHNLTKLAIRKERNTIRGSGDRR